MPYKEEDKTFTFRKEWIDHINRLADPQQQDLLIAAIIRSGLDLPWSDYEYLNLSEEAKILLNIFLPRTQDKYFIEINGKLEELMDKFPAIDDISFGINEKATARNTAQETYSKLIKTFTVPINKHNEPHNPMLTVETTDLPIKYNNDFTPIKEIPIEKNERKVHLMPFQIPKAP